MSKFIILQGIPASGKSTIARAWQGDDPTHRVIVNRDSLRRARGQYWVPNQEKFIEELETSMLNLAMAHCYDIIVDATNFNPETLERFAAMTKPYPYYEMETWLIHESMETCISRDCNEDRDHNVGLGVIDKFYRKYVAYCQGNNIEMIPGTILKRPFTCQ
jgi:predicted kinase